MPASPKDPEQAAAVRRQEFGDHTILTPPNRLRMKAASFVDAGGHEDVDPVRRAESALKLLSNEFDAWMNREVDALEKARRAAVGASEPTGLDALYRSAHDIRGQASTFGFPLAGQIADGLCALIEREGAGVPAQRLIDLHVDAIRAMVRENVRDRDNPVGAALVRRLSQLRDEVAAEN